MISDDATQHIEAVASNCMRSVYNAYSGTFARLYIGFYCTGRFIPKRVVHSSVLFSLAAA